MVSPVVAVEPLTTATGASQLLDGTTVVTAADRSNVPVVMADDVGETARVNVRGAAVVLARASVATVPTPPVALPAQVVALQSLSARSTGVHAGAVPVGVARRVAWELAGRVKE